MFTLLTLVTAWLLSVASLITAHPGEKYSAEQFAKKIAARDLVSSNSQSLVSTCGNHAKYLALRDRAASRRSLTAQQLREIRDIVDKPVVSRRDPTWANTWMNTCHDHTGTTNFDLTTAERAIFTSNATTALTPETLIGPYFVTGEVIRRNLTENQVGVPIHLDIQFIDMNTCEPVPSMLVDIWHCNATGAYSGVAAAGEGGLNSTFLRGVQTTDKDGVIQIDSIFPGHYDGRANHVHVLSRRGGTILPNNTYVGGTVNHVGQLYFDKDLVSEIESFYPYNTNKILRTTNEVDSFVPDESTAYTDPLVDYIKLSSDANDGLLMWMTIGINMTADYNGYVDAAAYHYVDGGVANPAATAIPFPPKHGIWPPWYPSIDPSGNIIKPTQTSTAKPWGPCFNKKQH